MSDAQDDDRTRIAPPPAPAAGAAARVDPPPPPAAATAASSAGDSGNALPIGTYLSEFEITRVIGEGGFGIVYDAWDHSLERRVALKEYMPASLASRESTQVQVRSMRHKETFDAGKKSFVNEAKLLAQFDHPSLVKVYRFWEANGTAYMVMPLYQGITLKDKLKQLGKAPDEAWLMGMLAPLTEALSVIHAENCFHRDIAPDNIILLAGSERPLLLDFGAARRVIGDMTQALTVILKPGYAPVEQYAETPNMKQGAWTDVYALAASMHFAILGKTPPPSVSRLMSDMFVPMVKSAEGRYSQTFLRGLDKALSVRPEERTQNISELRADLGLDAWAASQQPATRIRTVQPTHAAPRTGSGGVPAPTAAPTPPMHGPGNDAPTEISPRTEQAGAPAAGPAPASTAAWTPAPKPTRSGLFAGLGLGALAAIGAAGYFALSGGKSSAPSPAPGPGQMQAAAPAPAPAPVAAAAPTPPPPAVAAPAPAPFELRAEFEKVVNAQTPGFDVSAKPKKSLLRIDKDQVSFEITSSRDGFVRVLLLGPPPGPGPEPSLVLWYPNDSAKDARIKAGQKLVLPQSNWPMMAGEPAGPEHFLVVVSATPRHYGELIQGSDYIFKKFVPVARLQEFASRRAPDAPPLMLGLTKDCSPSPGNPCETYGAALFSIDVQR